VTFRVREYPVHPRKELLQVGCANAQLALELLLILLPQDLRLSGAQAVEVRLVSKLPTNTIIL
jgi:hypothetical protein